ncbi:MAG: tRNA uridine-5-carboxymethylaminomethyl(34) synthesis GTPase MnmE [Flavobacteriales bacterium]|nr:tRNA uridine-5-carboxymethylaminomethyl(34) synthesis GTPase MnmE [Flavobacteriales bacterium]
MTNFFDDSSICALATPPGVSAIAVIRISGTKAIHICNSVFSGRDLTQVASHSIHYGNIEDKDTIIDDVLVSVFKGPNSYTGENSIEISCHGSTYVQQRVMQLLIDKGARAATAGEFTKRAFLNGKLDLSQAEAVGDLISSDSANTHAAAINQMKGGYSAEINELRTKLIEFASLMELELDFSEEDVEFADRTQFKELLSLIGGRLTELVDSFAHGNVMKNGIAVVIAGRPNVGKSTLLNLLLKEDKAIISDIQGTTRDVIEDKINIKGIDFRFIDTAGIRETEDKLESIGIGKAYEQLQKSAITVYLFDASEVTAEDVQNDLDNIAKEIGKPTDNVILLGNKADLASNEQKSQFEALGSPLFISAKNNEGIEQLTNQLISMVDQGKVSESATIVTNNRHYDLLSRASIAIDQVRLGLDNNTQTDLLAIDIRSSLDALGEITGEITTDDLLENIFSKFCIGK